MVGKYTDSIRPCQHGALSLSLYHCAYLIAYKTCVFTLNFAWMCLDEDAMMETDNNYI